MSPKTKRHPYKKRSQGESKNASVSLLSRVLLALPCTFLVGLLLLLPVTAILLSAKDPQALLLPISLILCYLTAFFGGMIVMKMSNRRAPLFYGGALGVLLLLFYLLAALLAPRVSDISVLAERGHVARIFLPIATMLGAKFAARKKRAVRRH